MHHPESAGDSANTRKMAHPAIFPRRGSNTGSGNISVLATPAVTSISNNVIPADDYQSPLLIQPPPPAGSSSPGPQHPPQSLNLLSSQSQLQAQPLASAGAQLKKKSGFQITSVTPAQISVSTNNSIAEDTESYDDLDESHTEDLSSSEILDVSLSRATDMGGPERSSSEETLNNFHEAETPGAVSPNQPHLSNPPPQHGTMVNGTMHHNQQHHHHHHHHHHGHPLHHSPAAHPGVLPTAVSAPGGGGAAAAATSTTTTPLPSAEQKMSTNAGVALEPASVVTQSLPAGAPGTATGMLSVAAGTALSVNPLTSNVSNVNIAVASSASLPGLVSTSVTSTCSSTSGLPAGLMNLNTGSALMGTNSQNINLMQQQGSIVNPGVALAAAGVSGAPASSVIMGGAVNTQSGVAPIVQPAAVASVPQVQQQPQQQPPQPPPPTTTTSSRFRVVKLDSSSEPFRKGRWTCTEYYDKETPTMATATAPSDSMPSHRVVESIRQVAPESATGSERDSTSGSSVSSTVSTLSHYTESVGSGEVGAPSVLQAFQQQPPQALDYSSPQGLQTSHPGLPQSLSQSQLAQAHMHPQDVAHSLLKTSGAPSVPASIATVQQQAPINIASIQTSMGHPGAAIAQQQLAYAQKGQQPGPVQSLQGVPQQQQMGYSPQQQCTAPAQVPPAHVMSVSQGGSLPPDFTQHQQIIQTPVQPVPSGMGVGGQQPSQALPHISGTMAPQPGSGNGQMMSVGQQAGGSMATVVSQPTPQGILQQQQTSSPPQIAQPSQGGILQQMLPGTVSGLAQQLAKVHPQQQGVTQPQSQMSVEQPPLAQGLAGQQPSTMTLSQVATNVPPNVVPQPTMGQSATQSVQNGSVLPSVSQPSAMPARVSLPVGQGAAAQYPNLLPLTAAQLEDARRLFFHDQSLLSLPKLGAGEVASEAGTSLAQDASSGINALAASATLLPLKTLPLAAHVVDGEEDSSSGASVVTIDNKIEQAMDLVKSHLMYAVREEVEVLKEQIKELIERNSQLEQENNLLKNLASPEQLAQFQAQLQSGSPPAATQPPATAAPPAPAPAQPASQSTGPSA
ncbi:T22D1 protein, partial [Amia calva]|nr:T22D1 protein [Amia calva]